MNTVKRLLLILMVLWGMGCASGQILIGSRTPRVIVPAPVDTPSVPTLLSPADGVDSTSTTVAFSWSTTDSTDSYTINVASDTGFSTLLLNWATTGTTGEVSGLDSGTTYYWRVKSTNVAGSSSWATRRSFTTIPGSPPAAPILVAPANGVDSVSTLPLLTWTSVTTATSYRLQLSLSIGFLSNLLDTTVTGTSVQITDTLDYATLYYWRVRATNDIGSGAYASASFTTTPFVDTLRPAQVTTLAVYAYDSASISIKWTAVGDDSLTGTATSYTVRRNTDSITTANWATSVDVSGEPTPKAVGLYDSLTITGLSDSTKYYFALKVTDDIGNVSALSNVVSQITDTLSDTDVTRPAPITTLASYAKDTVTVSLRWLAVGDDSLTNAATSYDVRYASSPFASDEVIVNKHFETDTSGWTLYNSTLSRTDTAHGGSYAMVVQTSYEWGAAFYALARPGTDTAFYSAWVYLPGVSDTVSITLVDQNFTEFSAATPVYITANTWTQLKDTAVLSGTQTAITFAVQFNNAVTARRMFVDDVSLTFSGSAWASGTLVTGEPIPGAPGEYDSLTVTGLTASTVYYFAMKTADNVVNTSSISNVIKVTTGAVSETPGGLTSGTYYVAKTGHDDSAGTSTAPFLTIGKSLTVAGAGDTILVKSGTYSECLEFDSSGTDGSPLVLSNYGTDTVTVNGDAVNRIAVLGIGWNTDVNTERAAVSYINVQGLNISYQHEQSLATGSFFYGVAIGGASTSHITLDGCTLTSETDSAEGYSKNWKHYAICILGATYVTVSDNTVYGVFGGGWKFALYYGNMSAPGYQIWTGNTMTGWGSVINVGELADYADSTVLQKNLISLNNLYGAWEEDAIQFESGYIKPSYAESLAVHSGWYITKNDMWNCAENLVDLKGQREQIWLDENRMWWSRGDNNGVVDGTGTEGGAGLISKSRNSKYRTTWRFNEMWNNLGGMTPYVPAHVYHNTVVNNTMSHAGPRTFASGNGIQWGQGSLGDILRYPSVTRGLGINNISAENPTSTTQGGGAWVWANSDTLELDYNLYYDSSAAVKNKTLYTFVGEADTKSEWLIALQANPPYNIIGGDSNSIWADPQFTTAPFNAQFAEHTFEVDAGSPAVGAARCLTHTINSGTNSTSLAVVNPMAIFSGWSEVSLSGDSLLIGTSETPVLVTAVNNTTKVVTITPAQSWNVWDEVWLYRDGRKVDDIGAKQR